MQRYQLAGTKSSPTVDFNPVEGLLSLSGQSYPENPFQFFEPLMAWTDSYLSELTAEDEAVIEIQLSYMNTSSTKCLMMLLDKFEYAHAQGRRVSVRWICSPDNESEFECAEEMKEDLTLPFEIMIREVD